MKHISAYLGSPKVDINKKRAWWPKRASSGDWIRPLEQYYDISTRWAPVNTPSLARWHGGIHSNRILTRYEFILEGLNVDRG